MRKNKSRDVTVTTDEHMQTLIRSLLANLEGPYDRTSNMVSHFEVEDIPGDMPLEAQMMGIYNDCAQRSIPPTRENLIHGLRVVYAHAEADLEIAVDAVLSKKTASRDVAGLSAWLADDVSRRRAEASLEIGLQMIRSGSGSLPDRIREAVGLVSAAVPQAAGAESRLNDRELIETQEEVLRQRYKDRVNGVAPGPSLMLKGFAEKIPILRWGDTTLVTALPGRGKTAVSGNWAEYNAWELGFDVLYIHNETTPETMADRSIARNTLIPPDYLLAGMLNVDEKENGATKAYLDYKNWLSKNPRKRRSDGKEIEAGEIVWFYCPGWDVFQINTAISLMRRISDERGRGLLVIVDYYNLIRNDNFKGERAERLGQVAVHLRDKIKTETVQSKKNGGRGVHCIVLAQESEDSGEKYAFGSREIIQYSQVHISIQREYAMSDLPVKAKDALNNQRYLHRTGEFSSTVKFLILKANDNRLGDVIGLLENRFHAMSSPSETSTVKINGK